MDTTRSNYEDIAALYAPVGAGVLVLVGGLIVGFAVANRRSRRPAPRTTATAPRAEVVVIAVLVATAAALITATLVVDDRIRAIGADEPGVRVDALAFKWGWEFAYPDGGRRTVSGPDGVGLLVVPVDTPVRLSLRSRDVVHALWVPEVRYKQDLYPDVTTTTTLVFPREGRFRGHCAEFCGLRHAYMSIDVRVLSRAGFDAFARRGPVP